MTTLADQRAQFTWALNQCNLGENVDEQAKLQNEWKNTSPLAAAVS